jgi:serine/threonine-protein kinase
MSLPATASSERVSRPEGLVLEQKYRLGRELGSGSAGTVYEAENLAIRRRVAIKILDASLAKTPGAVARFQREAQAAGRLGHPHIVEVLDVGSTDEGVPFIVMEYLEGSTLRELLAREGRLEVPRAVDVALQALEVLQAAHAEGIIHRDLKPENLFLTRRGRRGDFVKVLDFGVAKFSEPGAGNLTDQGMTVGTPNYMSPEQVRGKELDPRSDVYSMAVVLWEMLAGRLPHEGESSNETMISIVTKDPPSLTEARREVDPLLSAILARAMRRSPDQRTGSARELAEALEPFGAAMEIDVGGEVVSLPPRALPALTPIPPSRTAGGSDTEPEGTPALRGQRDIATEYVSAVRGGSAARRWTTFAVAGAILSATAAVAVWGTGGTVVSLEHESSPAPMVSAPAPGGGLAPRRPDATTRPELPAPPAHPRPAAPAAARRVLVEVDANVPGAFVTLDGTPLGITPLRTEIDAAPGEHHLEVSADDRAPTRRTVLLDAPVRLTVELGSLPTPGPRGPRRPVVSRPQTKSPRPPGNEGTFDPFGRD